MASASTSKPSFEPFVIVGCLCASHVFATWDCAVFRDTLTAEERIAGIAYQAHENCLNLIVLMVSKEKMTNPAPDGQICNQTVASSASLQLKIRETGGVDSSGPVHLQDAGLNTFGISLKGVLEREVAGTHRASQVATRHI